MLCRIYQVFIEMKWLPFGKELSYKRQKMHTNRILFLYQATGAISAGRTITELNTTCRRENKAK